MAGCGAWWYIPESDRQDLLRVWFRHRAPHCIPYIYGKICWWSPLVTVVKEFPHRSRWFLLFLLRYNLCAFPVPGTGKIHKLFSFRFGWWKRNRSRCNVVCKREYVNRVRPYIKIMHKTTKTIIAFCGIELIFIFIWGIIGRIYGIKAKNKRT